ncbi:ABC-2 transporter permease [Ahniella affigens]|nr:ABC-2 transporter permease [Ahniella affigens]
MANWYRFLGILKADLRERTRTVRFWLMLGLMSWVLLRCFPGLDEGYMTLTLNGSDRGYYSSAWVGMVLAMVNTMLLSLGGFYLVRGTLTRDFETRVWQLLVSTTMTRSMYLLSKWISHLVIMSVVVTIGLLIALVAQWWRAEDRQIDLIELIKPSLVMSLPGLAITAMFAIWFDLVPWLRKTAGNVLFFFVWTFLTAISVAQFANGKDAQAVNNWRSDPNGMAVAARDFYRLERLQTGDTRDFSLSIGSPKPKGPVHRFEWKHWHVRPMDLLGRSLWILVAIGGVLLAVPFLDRAAAKAGVGQRQQAGSGARLWWLKPVFGLLALVPGTQLLQAELKLALRSRRWWWWVGFVALLSVQAFAPAEGAHVALLIALVWPLDLLAHAMLRETSTHTGGLVLTASRAIERLIGARWLAGTLILVALCAPSLLRLGVQAPISALALLVVLASLPALALAMAMLSRSARPFELLLVASVYIATQGAALFQVETQPWECLETHGLLGALAVSVLALGRLHWARAAIGR